MQKVIDSFTLTTRHRKPENQDAAFTLSAESAPADRANMLISCVMDGVTTANGREAAAITCSILRSHMLALLQQHEADVVQCAYRDVYRDRTVDQIHRAGRTVFRTPEYLKRYTTDWTCGLLWDKLYRRTLFDGIFFEEGHRIDDEYFTYQGVMNANRVVCDERIIYNYRKRRSSVMASPESGQKILLDRIDYLGKRRRNIGKRFPQLRVVFDRHFLESMLFLSTDPHYTLSARSAICSALAEYLREKGHTPIPAGWLLPLAKLYFRRPRITAAAAKNEAADNFFD